MKKAKWLKSRLPSQDSGSLGNVYSLNLACTYICQMSKIRLRFWHTTHAKRGCAQAPDPPESRALKHAGCLWADARAALSSLCPIRQEMICKGSEGLHGCWQLRGISGQVFLSIKWNSFRVILGARRFIEVTHPAIISAERDIPVRASFIPNFCKSSRPVGRLVPVCPSATRRPQTSGLMARCLTFKIPAL